MTHAFDHAPMANCPFMPVFGPPAVMFERGRGTELWDSDGKRYLDFLAGIAVVSAEIDMEPSTTQAVEGKQAEQMIRLMEAFDDHDDVQKVWANFDVDDELLDGEVLDRGRICGGSVRRRGAGKSSGGGRPKATPGTGETTKKRTKRTKTTTTWKRRTTTTTRILMIFWMMMTMTPGMMILMMRKKKK